MDLQGRWYAVHVRPRFEKIVARQLEAKGYEQFVPLSVDRRRNRDRELPLIPGYVFCRIMHAVVGHIVTTPGVIRIVSSGNMWLPVDDSEIEALQRVVHARVPAEPWSGAHAGQIVEIVSGPLSGLQGVLCRFDRGDRLLISVAMLRRTVAVEVDREHVVPVPTWQLRAGHSLAVAHGPM